MEKRIEIDQEEKKKSEIDHILDHGHGENENLDHGLPAAMPGVVEISLGPNHQTRRMRPR